jgi:hypothetical protein
MTAEQYALMLIRGAIASAPDEEQNKIRTAAEQLRSLIAANGEPGKVALALVGAELAAE